MVFVGGGILTVVFNGGGSDKIEPSQANVNMHHNVTAKSSHTSAGIKLRGSNAQYGTGGNVRMSAAGTSQYNNASLSRRGSGVRVSASARSNGSATITNNSFQQQVSNNNIVMPVVQSSSVKQNLSFGNQDLAMASNGESELIDMQIGADAPITRLPGGGTWDPGDDVPLNGGFGAMIFIAACLFVRQVIKNHRASIAKEQK